MFTSGDILKIVFILFGSGATVIGKLVWDKLIEVRKDIDQLQRDIDTLQQRKIVCDEKFVRTKEYDRVVQLLDRNSKDLHELTAAVSQLKGILSGRNDEQNYR